MGKASAPDRPDRHGQPLREPEHSLSAFLESFIGGLASPAFSAEGSLADYLAMPAEQRRGDEAKIVDVRVTQLLIESLGYAGHEYEYNAQVERQRPDFIVKIKEYPRPACFIVEDKNTTESDLGCHRPQLQGYMTQLGVSRGMLINGGSILAYDQMEGSVQTPAINIDLLEAVGAWASDGGLFAKGKSKKDALDECGQLPNFSALWQRFGRGGFAGLSSLIDDLTLQNENGKNAPHGIDGRTWVNALCRIPIVPITHENAAHLTNTVKGLIAEFEDDADAQLAALEADYREYERAAEKIPTDGIALHAEEDGLVAQAMGILAKADSGAKKDIEGRLRRIMCSEAPVKDLDDIESYFYQIQKAERKKNDQIQGLTLKIRAHAERRFRYIGKLRARHERSVDVIRHFEAWKEKTASLVFPSESPMFLRREFLAQTAYLVIIRILVVRIMEDKGLVNRMFTNGGIALWFREVEPHYLKHAMGRSADFLLDLAYTSAQHVYSHFYDQHAVLDWYVPDRNAVVKVLHKLAGFDLGRINRDIMGTVYGQYIEARHKHDSGMYYTPPDIVSFMLDRIGYRGAGVIGKKLLDLSCGSGGFLVEAAARLVEAHAEYWRAQGHAHIPADHVQAALNEIRECLHGMDLNPFACALAETNLLIQVIDLVNIAHKAGQPATIGRFHIYASDSLTFAADTLSAMAGTLPLEMEDLPVEDQMKAGIGRWKDKFDYIVGNPPYVRADVNPQVQPYRERVRREHPIKEVRDTMVFKWDLFVPFVAASLKLLRPGSGRMAMITSSAIETVPYCGNLRELLVTASTVDEVHFFGGLRLFRDAAVQNTITIATNGPPGEGAETVRFRHTMAPGPGVCPSVGKKLLQTQCGQGVFRQGLPTIEVAEGARAVPLHDIFYISVGMVLNADEKVEKGAFSMKDLISDEPDGIHCAAFAGSKDIDYFGIKNLKYLEYGPGTRVPASIRRTTFPELYDRPKLMVARFTGFAYDDGAWDELGFLKCNHGVNILVPWCNLRGVDNKAIRSELGGRLTNRGSLEAASAKIDPWYVLAFLGSSQMAALLAGVSRSAIDSELNPDDLRQISIPIPDDPKAVRALADMAKRAHGVHREMMLLRKKGWRIEDDGAAAPADVPGGVPKLALARARVKWGLTIALAAAGVHGLRRDGGRLFHGRQEAARMGPPENAAAMEWLRRQLLCLPAGTTLGEAMRMDGFFVPETLGAAEGALGALEQTEAEARGKLLEIKRLRGAISDGLRPLFREAT
jgi:hypothetical protein